MGPGGLSLFLPLALLGLVNGLGACANSMPPLGPVCCLAFPVIDANVAFLERSLQGVSEAEFGPAAFAMPPCELAVEQLFWYSVILHAHKVS